MAKIRRDDAVSTKKELLKYERALEAALTAERGVARSLWNEDRNCRLNLSKLYKGQRNADPITAKAVKTEIGSLNKQANILSTLSAPRVSRATCMIRRYLLIIRYLNTGCAASSFSALLILAVTPGDFQPCLESTAL